MNIAPICAERRGFYRAYIEVSVFRATSFDNLAMRQLRSGKPAFAYSKYSLDRNGSGDFVRHHVQIYADCDHDPGGRNGDDDCRRGWHLEPDQRICASAGSEAR